MELNHKQRSATFPKDKAYKLSDGDEMYLLVKLNGGKYHRFK